MRTIRDFSHKELEQVLIYRDDKESKFTYKEIAKIYNCSEKTISKFVNKSTRKDFWESTSYDIEMQHKDKESVPKTSQTPKTKRKYTSIIDMKNKLDLIYSLGYLRNMDYSEIAKIVDVSPSSIRNILLGHVYIDKWESYQIFLKELEYIQLKREQNEKRTKNPNIFKRFWDFLNQSHDL